MTQSLPKDKSSPPLAFAIAGLKISMARGLAGGVDPKDDPDALRLLKVLEDGYRGKSAEALRSFLSAIRLPETLPGISRRAVLARGHRFLYSLGIEIDDMVSDIAPTKENRNSPKDAPPSQQDVLYEPALLNLAGIGPKTAQRLAVRGITSPRDILFLLPRRYDDRRTITKIADASPGQRIVTTGSVAGVRVFGRPWKSIMELTLQDGDHRIYGTWFTNRRPRPDRFQPGQKIFLAGLVSNYKGRLQIAHPTVQEADSAGEISGQDHSPFGRIVPVYPEIPGIAGRVIEKAIRHAAENADQHIIDPLPEWILSKRNLTSLPQALELVHCPPVDIPAASLDMWVNGSSPAHTRLAYDEFFFLQLALADRRRETKAERATPIATTSAIPKELGRLLSLKLTTAQHRVLGEIFTDLGQKHPMQRLLQGDVGSGKTLVALGALVAAANSHVQAALMAPTEILAEQHMRTLYPVLKRLGIRSVLHIGNARASTRKKNLDALQKGTAKVAIGTHALLQETVQFHNLGLAIVDEQHRFGVSQRLGLVGKGQDGSTPHLLVMTATPIPRTLALTVHGDLDVSIIDELPPGRTKIETRLWSPPERERVFEIADTAMERKEQVYVVCPIIEESEHLQVRSAETVHAELCSRFDKRIVGLLHGRLSTEEKDRIMTEFANGNIDLLVATTVIEVGVDVPRATVMIIEGAERFGLAQLHQLRGRVGRSHLPSSCHLIAETDDEDGRAAKRLEAFLATEDGFQLAEADLKIRGPGEIYGRRQAGLPGFRYGDLVRDAGLLIAARDDARAILEETKLHSQKEMTMLREELLRRIAAGEGPIGEEAG